MLLDDLGYNDTFEQFRIDQKLDDYEIGRVIIENKGRYIVRTAESVYDSEIFGTMRYRAENRVDYPAVGDWVAVIPSGTDLAIIHHIFPRKSIIERQSVGKFGKKQIIASNVDYAFIIQAVETDFNINRLERYLTISNSSNVEPIIVLTKIDLITKVELKKILQEVKERVVDILTIPISNKTKKGYELFDTVFMKGKTYCFLGSSGAGKSTLINNLSGEELMVTDSINAITHKGRHVTSHRELTVLSSGGILIDNPGMREVGVTDTTSGLEETFDDIIELSHNCRFSDCSHTHEKDCSVLSAVENGEINKTSYENYLRLGREKTHFQSSVVEKRRKDKQFGKTIKAYLKNKKKG